MTSFALFLVRRLLGIVVLVWAVTLAAFGLFRAGGASPASRVQIDTQLGQGEPAAWQYFHYVLRLLHGNLGESLTVGLSVNTVLWRALPPTLSLMIGGMVLWLAEHGPGGATGHVRYILGTGGSGPGSALARPAPSERPSSQASSSASVPLIGPASAAAPLSWNERPVSVA